jgi:galactonate dehydratase
MKLNAVGRMRAVDRPSVTGAVVERATAVREVIGSDNDFALDFHGRVAPASARRLLPLLEPLHPLFVEEPVLPDVPTSVLAGIVTGTTVPIATGERLYGPKDFPAVLEAGVAIVQPDVSHAGGISELRRIAALAETFEASIAPHCPLGPIALAASLQVAFATPNHLIQEQSLGIHYNEEFDLLDYLVDPDVFRFSQGAVERSALPGLGIDVDSDAVRRASELGHRWRTPQWRHDDGSFAEW